MTASISQHFFTNIDFDLNSHPTISQVCKTLAILTSVVLLDSHWTNEEILSKLCGNNITQEVCFLVVENVRKQKMIYQLSKTQEGQGVSLQCFLRSPISILSFFNIFIDYASTVVPFPTPSLYSILPTPSLPHSPPIFHVNGSYL